MSVGILDLSLALSLLSNLGSETMGGNRFCIGLSPSLPPTLLPLYPAVSWSEKRRRRRRAFVSSSSVGREPPLLLLLLLPPFSRSNQAKKLLVFFLPLPWKRSTAQKNKKKRQKGWEREKRENGQCPSLPAMTQWSTPEKNICHEHHVPNYSH